MADQLKGKVAIVTGAASGIGAACVETFAREGAKVVATDIDDGTGEDSVAKIKAPAGEAIYLSLDVMNEGRWSEVVAATEARYGRLDILVANAAIMLISPTIEMRLEDWRRQMAVNLDSAFLSVKHCVPAMRRTGGGSIIMMSSVAGLHGTAGLAGFCATKGGMRLFTKAIALEYASEGIRANSVHPGIIDTPIWGKLSVGGRNIPVDLSDMAQKRVPTGEPGRAQDVADGVLFLASDMSRHVTGAEIVIDGGMMAGAPRRG
jgi:NAD(P)-dependent dehydrogenase (short-subunit alcohol dehydrogenase family)